MRNTSSIAQDEDPSAGRKNRFKFLNFRESLKKIEIDVYRSTKQGELAPPRPARVGQPASRTLVPPLLFPLAVLCRGRSLAPSPPSLHRHKD